MLANVVDVDESMQLTALTAKDGAAVFFDFAAAFPSVGQDFLLEVLTESGIPGPMLHYLRALYHNNRCRMIVGGSVHEGFSVTAGIRQGCPLSPLLFAVAADLLLRRLGRTFPNATRRAYADDLALVLREGASAAGQLETLFDEYAAISGLRLNLAKTVWVPLRTGDPVAARTQVMEHAPSWVGMHFAHYAKYLGFYLGPARGEKGWSNACKKFLKRVKDWGQSGGGMLVNTVAYSVYAFSTLAFLVQLDSPPAAWKQLEAEAL